MSRSDVVPYKDLQKEAKKCGIPANMKVSTCCFNFCLPIQCIRNDRLGPHYRFVSAYFRCWNVSYNNMRLDFITVVIGCMYFAQRQFLESALEAFAENNQSRIQSIIEFHKNARKRRNVKPVKDILNSKNKKIKPNPNIVVQLSDIPQVGVWLSWLNITIAYFLSVHLSSGRRSVIRFNWRRRRL